MFFFTKTRKSKIYNMSKICKLVQKRPQKLAKISESGYRKQICKIASRVAKNIGEKNIVLIAGPSSSGKTTTSHLLVKELEKLNIVSVVVSMDDFFVSREETPVLESGRKDYDNITSLNLDLFKKCIDELITNKSTSLPVFDFVEGRRNDNAVNVEMAKENGVIIVEGIHAFNPLIMSDLMRGKCIKIYISAEADFDTENGLLSHNTLRFCRRLIRDFLTRGNTVEDTERVWRDVREAEELFISPFKDTADFHIDTVHAYEPLLYKNELLNIAQEDENALKYLNLFMNDVEYKKDYISKDSVVWEFLSVHEEKSDE